MPVNFFISKYFSMRAVFVQTLHISLNYFENIPELFTASEYGKTQTCFINALGPETKEQIKLAKDKIPFDL